MTPGGLTPRPGKAGAIQTPLRTPVRDKLNINQEDEVADPEFAKYRQVICYYHQLYLGYFSQ